MEKRTNHRENNNEPRRKKKKFSTPWFDLIETSAVRSLEASSCLRLLLVTEMENDKRRRERDEKAKATP